ncbi:MAG: hypothetical protein ACT4QF_14485 [Sporichthyaceae bacterium]
MEARSTRVRGRSAVPDSAATCTGTRSAEARCSGPSEPRHSSAAAPTSGAATASATAAAATGCSTPNSRAAIRSIRPAHPTTAASRTPAAATVSAGPGQAAAGCPPEGELTEIREETSATT